MTAKVKTLQKGVKKAVNPKGIVDQIRCNAHNADEQRPPPVFGPSRPPLEIQSPSKNAGNGFSGTQHLNSAAKTAPSMQRCRRPRFS